MADLTRPTVVVNIFGGPGVGKTTAALEVSEKLKKLGYVVDYAPEYAKELVWTINSTRLSADRRRWARDLLDGTIINQTALYDEQKYRVDRLLGQCDFVVTDSPALLGCLYLKADNNAERKMFEKRAMSDFNQQNNFNIVAKRSGTYESEGRLQNASEAAQLDKDITNFLSANDVYTGTYHHETIDLAIENMQKTLSHLQGKEPRKEALQIQARAKDLKIQGKQDRENGQELTDEKGSKKMSVTTSAENPVIDASTTKPEWVNITMKGAFLKECTNKEKGSQFYDVRIPEGTKIGGVLDVGNCHFTVDASRVHESKYDPHGVQIGLIKEKPLKLKKPIRQEDGTFANIEKSVQPENLRVALDTQYKNYKATKAAERAAKNPDRAVSKGARATPTKDQRDTAKSASARSKGGTKQPPQKIN